MEKLKTPIKFNQIVQVQEVTLQTENDLSDFLYDNMIDISVDNDYYLCCKNIRMMKICDYQTSHLGNIIESLIDCWQKKVFVATQNGYRTEMTNMIAQMVARIINGK